MPYGDYISNDQLKRRKIFKIILLVGAVLGLYWIKCQLGINIFHDLSFSRTFHLSAFERKTDPLIEPVKGVDIINDNFDLGYFKWNGLWSRDKDRVRRYIVWRDFQKLFCMAVKSSSDQDWAVVYNGLAAVWPGDLLCIRAGMLVSGEADAGLSVVLYDQNKKVIKWSYGAAKQEISDRGRWGTVMSVFEVPDGVSFVKLRFCGRGKGDAYIDDVRFFQEN